MMLPPSNENKDHDVTFNESNTDDIAIVTQKSSAHFLFGIKERYKLPFKELFKQQVLLNNAYIS